MGVVVTANKHKAIELARAVDAGMVRAEMICDDDWFLLLLAAGPCDPEVGATTVARKVIAMAERCAGYFAPSDRPNRNKRARLTLAA